MTSHPAVRNVQRESVFDLKKKFFNRLQGNDLVSVEKAFVEYNVRRLVFCGILCHLNWLL